MIIKSLLGGPVNTLSYLVIDKKSKKAMVIDPVEGSFAKFSHHIKKENLELIYIVDTHGHFDHISDNSVFKSYTKAKLTINKWDEPMIKKPSLIWGLKIIIKPSSADFYIKEADTLIVGGLKLKVIETPGHTKGSICLYEEKDKVIFTGDTLFKGTYGRTDFPGGDIAKIKESLRRLARLPKNVKVYPGHGEKTTIGEELYWLSAI
ncbi:MBL fold metallo-hydrolase [Candidatus Woesearchaeota archaeon]|nr:MBL fold metallo-hydrolase [Candidatus Woesearchaeota archaeon]